MASTKKSNAAPGEARPTWLAHAPLAALALCLAFLVAAERDVASLPFSAACWGLIAAFAYMLTARPQFSIFLACAALMLSALASMAKFKMLAVNAHVFDIWFYATKPDTLVFLASEFAPYLAGGAIALSGLIVGCWMLARRERPAAARPFTAGAIVLGCAAALPFTLPPEAGELAYHIQKNHFASSFFVSFSDIARLTRPSPIAARLTRDATSLPFESDGGCRAGESRPDIVLTLSESGVPPAQIPGWKFDPSLQDYFKSWDGEVHRARVETHGGGTWISHTSVNTGLSMADFGWMRPYATMLLRNQLHHGLAAALQKCGYKTAIISPQSYNFVNEGPMLTSLGFEDYIDRAQLDAPSKHEADSFYFGKALEYFTRHAREDRRPLFLFVVTMAAHSPYDFRFLPERTARGEPFGNDPASDEFLRRLTFAQEDYTAFVAELKATGKPVLAAQFGDHHPTITREIFEAAGQPQSMKDWRSPIYETFYAVQPVNFTPAAPLPRVDVLDLAYLGVTLLDVAGLPLDPAFEDKRALRALCDGAFHTCADQAAVDRHLGRMWRSGLLDEPNTPPRDPLTAQTGDQ